VVECTIMTSSGPGTAISPDWAGIDERIVCTCPLCEYNLRGLTEPRCPECGYRFEWGEVLDPHRRLHPYLFEHHPERNLWSFRKTLFGGLLPGRFWRSLLPVQPSCPRRLLLYGCIVGGLYLLAWVAQAGLLIFCMGQERIRYNRRDRQRAAAMLVSPQRPVQLQSARQIRQQFGSIQGYLDAVYPVEWNLTLLSHIFRWSWPSQEVWLILLLLLFPLVWPWLVVASLLVFRVSMRRARIKPIHVLRSVVYSMDVLAWAGLAVVASAAIVLVTQRGSPQPALVMMPGLLTIIFVLGVGIAAYRIGTAYRRYLRFDHPFAVILASHIIASLVLLELTLMYLSRSIW
jgi:hypothetical protein